MESLTLEATEEAQAPVGPSLSVLIISKTGDVEPALRRIASLCDTIGAQLVVAAAGKGEFDLARLRMQWPTVDFVGAEQSCIDCDLRAAGMALVTGDMVAIRCCDALGDLSWLRPFFPHMALSGMAAVAAFGSLGVDARWDRRKNKVAYVPTTLLPAGRDRRRRADAAVVTTPLAAAAAEI